MRFWRDKQKTPSPPYKALNLITVEDKVFCNQNFCILRISVLRDFLVAQMVKCLPAVRETWVLSLGQADPLEKEMAPHSSTVA